MIHKEDLSFARKAIRRGMVTGEQVIECVELMKLWHDSQQPQQVSLLDVLQKKGYLQQAQVEQLQRELAEKNSHKPPLLQEKIGKYELLEKVGEGAMGVVYKARHRGTQKVVAVKILDEELAADQEFIARFLREAKNAAKLKHSNIVEAYDFGEKEGRYYFVMEYVDGCSLAAILASKGGISEQSALAITKQMAHALDHAHKFSIVHRDVKPENIMISRDGSAKLCDLGLARDLSEDICKTTGGITLGTVYYASPEQVRGKRDIDIRSDIYSLGISLYYMLSGELPFNDTELSKVAKRQIKEELPGIVKNSIHASAGTLGILKKMTAKSKDLRYQTPQELLVDLEKAMHQKEEDGQEQADARTPSKKRSTERLVPRKQQPTWQDLLFLYRYQLVIAMVIVGILLLLLIKIGSS